MLVRVGYEGIIGMKGGVGKCSRCRVRPRIRMLGIREVSAFLRQGGAVEAADRERAVVCVRWCLGLPLAM